MNNALNTAGGLAVVIALILGVAWLLRGAQRFGVRGHGLLRVVASQALSTRERVVVVELADTWLVLGVAPGQVSRLARLARPASPTIPVPSGGVSGVAPGVASDVDSGAAPSAVSGAASFPSSTTPAPAAGFQGWLERAMQRGASLK